jgi:hypothetical protein
LHAIFPDNLDSTWEIAVNVDACAGALSKRFNVFPAGVAVVSAINAGVADLRLIVPGAFDKLNTAMNHLDDLNRVLAGNRNAGSVNRRFYDAPNVRPDEVLLAPIASIIVASLNQFAPGNPLNRSRALKRCADNAPITGGLVGRMINTAATSTAAAETFLPTIHAPPVQGGGVGGNP